jgi:hypothetical protein
MSKFPLVGVNSRSYHAFLGIWSDYPGQFSTIPIVRCVDKKNNVVWQIARPGWQKPWFSLSLSLERLSGQEVS